MTKFVKTYNIVQSPCINAVQIADWNWKNLKYINGF